MLPHDVVTSYVGKWRHGKPSGPGVMTFSEVSYYDGDFLDGLQHGRGYLHLDNGLR